MIQVDANLIHSLCLLVHPTSVLCNCYLVHVLAIFSIGQEIQLLIGMKIGNFATTFSFIRVEFSMAIKVFYQV